MVITAATRLRPRAWCEVASVLRDDRCVRITAAHADGQQALNRIWIDAPGAANPATAEPALPDIARDGWPGEIEQRGNLCGGMEWLHVNLR